MAFSDGITLRPMARHAGRNDGPPIPAGDQWFVFGFCGVDRQRCQAAEECSVKNQLRFLIQKTQEVADLFFQKLVTSL